MNKFTLTHIWRYSKFSDTMEVPLILMVLVQSSNSDQNNCCVFGVELTLRLRRSVSYKLYKLFNIKGINIRYI